MRKFKILLLYLSAVIILIMIWAAFFFKLSILLIAIILILTINFYVLRALDKEFNLRISAEKEARQAKKEWDRTFNGIPDFVFIQDYNFVIIRANKAFCDALGLKPQDVIGRKCHEVVHKTTQHWPGCPFSQTLMDRSPHIEEVNDPSLGIPLLVTTSPLFDDNGKFLGAVHLAKDITNIKENEEQLKKKIDELERFQGILVDREIRMKELKEEIGKLKSRLNE